MIRSHERLEIEYGVAEESNLHDMTRLLGVVFSRHDPPAVATGLTPAEFEEFVRLLCPAVAAGGLPGESLHLFLLGVGGTFGGRGVAQHLVTACLENGLRRGYVVLDAGLRPLVGKGRVACSSLRAEERA